MSALAVLSGMDVGRFKAAVVDSDTASIAKISGLGKKTAERIVLEPLEIPALKSGVTVDDVVLAWVPAEPVRAERPSVASRPWG